MCRRDLAGIGHAISVLLGVATQDNRGQLPRALRYGSLICFDANRRVLFDGFRMRATEICPSQAGANPARNGFPPMHCRIAAMETLGELSVAVNDASAMASFFPGITSALTR